MNSTDLHPLAYFEYIIDSKNILKEMEKELFYSDYYTIDKENLTEVKTFEQNEFGKFEETNILTKDLLLPKLFREFQKTKNHLYNFTLYNAKLTSGNYLEIQVNILQKIINNHSDLINRHSYFILPIRGILNYINNILKSQEMNSFVLDESNISYGETKILEQIGFDSTIKSDIEIIHSIFDYMNGMNEKREDILSEEDFNLLIKYTSELVEQEKTPVFEKQLQPKISNDLLRFSYWVLHNELYTTKRIKPYFYDFVKTVFLNFKESEISSIKKQFGTSTRVKKDRFLPEIILKNLE